MMNNSDRLDKSAKAESLYKFFKGNAFLTSGNVQLKSNYSRGKKSPWSLRFSNDKCIKEIFRIYNPSFCGKYAEAIGGGGHEIQKIHTLHSSSLAALLLFQHVSETNPISVPINGCRIRFTECHFEHKNQVWEKDSHNFSNVDIMLVDKKKKNILFLESKFSEYLTRESMDFSYTEYYMNMYDDISKTLNGLGIKHRKDKKTDKKGREKEIIRLEIIKKDKPIYCEGIKQMISHYMGVMTECRKGSFKDKNVYLGEILFDFKDWVPNAGDCLNSYRNAYESLREVLQKKAGTQFGMMELMTWQDLLKDNSRYLETLEPDIKAYYRL